MDTILQAIWFNTHGFEDELYPYKLIYGLIYENLLNQKYHFRVPGYEVIYIDIGISKLLPASEKSAYSASVAVEFDIDNYKQADEAAKGQMVISLFADGLTKLALRDGIDPAPIYEVTRIARQYGPETLLNIKNIDTGQYSLKIEAPAISYIQPEPVYLTFYQKASGRSKTICIGTAEMIQAGVWLQKITVSSKTIRIRSSSSVRFIELLKDLPAKIEYNIEDLLSG